MASMRRAFCVYHNFMQLQVPAETVYLECCAHQPTIKGREFNCLQAFLESVGRSAYKLDMINLVQGDRSALLKLSLVFGQVA